MFWHSTSSERTEKDRNNSAAKIPMSPKGSETRGPLYRSTPCRRSSGAVYFFELSVFQIVGQEGYGAIPGVGGIGGTVSVFVVGIFEGMAGVVVNLDVDLFA
jgi:hypothetical protein